MYVFVCVCACSHSVIIMPLLVCEVAFTAGGYPAQEQDLTDFKKAFEMEQTHRQATQSSERCAWCPALTC